MSDTTSNSTEVKTTGPEYLAWRGELLAQLALSRLEGVTVYQRSDEQPFDFLVATNDGLCFFVEVEAFSSTNQKIDDVETIEELQWQIPMKRVRQATGSQTPVLLFLFDADSDHGRFLRLDTLPAPDKAARQQTIAFPIENVIDQKNLEAVIRELRLEKAKDS